MNNSFLAQQKVKLSLEEAPKQALEEREVELRKLLSAVEKVLSLNEWSTLKEKVFDPHIERLNKELLSEAKKDKPDTEKLNRISGQLTQAERYDLEKLKGAYRLELTNIKLNNG